MSAKHTDTSGTSNTQTAQNFTSTPTNPDWSTQGVQGLAGTLNNLNAQNPSSFVAPANNLQNLASANATNLSTTPWDYDAANQVAGDVANQTSPSISADMSKFMDPYTQQVVNTTLQGFDQNAGYTQAQDQLSRAGDTTFGGSGGAIQTALDNQNIANERAATQAQLENQGYNTALTGATSQANIDQQTEAQRLAASQAITNNANSYNAAANQTVDTQSALGQILQQLQQAQAQAPLSVANSIGSTLGSLPLSLFQGQTGNTSGTSANQTTGTGTSEGLSVGWNSKNGLSIGG